MNRNLSLVAILLTLLLSVACGSMNRVTPEAADEEVMEADVRGKIAAVDPSRTFAVEVKVDSGVVTLNGHVDSESDRQKIGEAAASVNGVKRVINNLHVKR